MSIPWCSRVQLSRQPPNPDQYFVTPMTGKTSVRFTSYRTTGVNVGLGPVAGAGAGMAAGAGLAAGGGGVSGSGGGSSGGGTGATTVEVVVDVVVDDWAGGSCASTGVCALARTATTAINTEVLHTRRVNWPISSVSAFER
jgi:hypothetical protein